MYRIRFTAPLLLPFVLALTGTLAACSEDRPSRAITIDDQDAGNNDAGDPESDKAAPEPEVAAGRQLTQEQAAAALLSVRDLPSGWAGAPNDEDDGDSVQDVDPPRCQEVLESLDAAESGHAPVNADVTFNKGGTFGTTLAQSLASFDTQVDADWLQSVADGFTECPEFTYTDDGQASDVAVSPMSFANLGDQTLAFALNLSTSGFTVAFNVAYIAIGHNMITLILGGLAGVDGAELERIGRKAVAKLEDAAP